MSSTNSSPYPSWTPSPAQPDTSLASPHIPRQLFQDDEPSYDSPVGSPYRPNNGQAQQQGQDRTPMSTRSGGGSSSFGYAEEDFGDHDGGSIAANAAASLFSSADVFDMPDTSFTTPSQSAPTTPQNRPPAPYVQQPYTPPPNLIPAQLPGLSYQPHTPTTISPFTSQQAYYPPRTPPAPPQFSARPPPLPKTITVHADRALAYTDPTTLRPSLRRKLDEIMSQRHVRITVKKPTSPVPIGGITGSAPGLGIATPSDADVERQGQVEIEIAGGVDRVEIARMSVLAALDELSGLYTQRVNLEPSNPNMYHNIIAGPKRRVLKSIMRRTKTNIYLPSPFVVQSVDMAEEVAAMVVTGSREGVEEACGVLLELADQKNSHIVQQTLPFPTHKLDWMLANRRDVLTRCMWDNGTFILFHAGDKGSPPTAPSCRLVTFLGDDRVYVDRTIRMLTLLACECYVACVELSHPIHALPNAQEAASYNGWPSSPHNNQASQQAPAEFDWKKALESIAETTRAIVVLRDQGRGIEILGVEATCKSAYGLITELENIRPFINKAHFRISLAAEHREFIRGKKDGKITRVVKGSGGCMVRVEDDRIIRTVTVVVEHHDPARVLEGVALIEEELPAELAFHLPERYHKQAIGVGGRRIQAIMRRREAYVKFASSEEVSRTGGFDVGEVGDNVIVRTPARNARNLELVRRDVEAAVGWAEGGNQGEGFVSVQMRVPRRYHRRMMARGAVFGGSYPGADDQTDAVSEIEERTGVRIRFPDREIGQDDVTIEGPQRGVEAAARVVQAMIPSALHMSLPGSAAPILLNPKFKEIWYNPANLDFETEVRFWIPGLNDESGASSPTRSTSSSSPTSGSLLSRGSEGKEEPVELIIESDEPHRVDEVAWASIAPYLASQGIPLPQRRPPLNTNTSGFSHVDHRVLVDAVQREREMRERDIMMRAVSEQQGRMAPSYDEEFGPGGQGGEGDDRWDMRNRRYHRGGARGGGSSYEHPSRSSGSWRQDEASWEAGSPRGNPPPGYGGWAPQGQASRASGYNSPTAPSSPTRSYPSQGQRPNTVPRAATGSSGTYGNALRLNMGAGGSGYSQQRFPPGMTPPRGTPQSPARPGQYAYPVTPIGAHPPINAYYPAAQSQPLYESNASDAQEGAAQAVSAASAEDSQDKVAPAKQFSEADYVTPRKGTGVEGVSPKTGDARIFSLLQRVGLEKYHQVFTGEEVDYSTFLSLTDSDLKELGVSTFGARKRILTAVQEDRQRQGIRTQAENWPSPESHTISAENSISEDADPEGVAAQLAGLTTKSDEVDA